jgi:hypothetical protein
MVFGLKTFAFGLLRPKTLILLVIHGIMQGTPRGVKQFVDFTPIFFRHAARFGFRIVDFHRVGSESPGVHASACSRRRASQAIGSLKAGL